MTLEHSADPNRLLDKLKDQYTGGPIRPLLYQILPTGGLELPGGPLSYQWMYYAGMGDTALHPIHPEQARVVIKLISEGRLVPTFEEDFYDARIRRIEHFDDVKFGLDEEDRIVAYDFALNAPGENNPDPLLTTDKIHPGAIKRITSRMDFSIAAHAITADPDAIRLVGGPTIRPILTDAKLIETRRRQIALKAEQK